MKNSNITKNRTRIALLLVLAASIISVAPVFSTSAMASSYSINDVSGNYVDLDDGFTVANPNKPHDIKNPVPFSQVGLITFTPSTGTFHADWIVRFYGES